GTGEVCNEGLATTVNFRSLLTGEDAGGSWTFVGFSADDTTYGAGGTAPGTIVGADPTHDFTGYIVGFYKFQYCVTDAGILDCEDCEDIIIEVVACPCETNAGTPYNIELCN